MSVVAFRRGLATVGHRTGLLGALTSLGDHVSVRRGGGRLAPERRRADTFLVLAYHRVNEDRARFAIETTPTSAFRGQMEYLARRFRVLSLETIVARIREGEPLPRRAAAVTFDDGYADNHDHAFPVLRTLGLPATVFLATGCIDTGIAPWFDRVFHAFERGRARRATLPGGLGEAALPDESARFDAGLRSLYALLGLPDAERRAEVDRLERELDAGSSAPSRMLRWDQVRAMAAQGVSFGSHTVTHPILSMLPPERVRAELAESKRKIEIELERPAPLFAYPSGKPADYSESVVRIVRETGFAAALTTSVGSNARGDDLYRLRRVKPRGHDVPTFALGLTYHHLVREEGA